MGVICGAKTTSNSNLIDWVTMRRSRHFDLAYLMALCFGCRALCNPCELTCACSFESFGHELKNVFATTHLKHLLHLVGHLT